MIGISSAAPFAYTQSGGVWIVMGVLLLGLIAIIFAYFTEKGTEIRFHAWGDERGDAPGSLGVGNVGKDRTVDVRNWTRGTSSGRRGNRPAPRPARAQEVGDTEVLARLTAWRSRSSSGRAGLYAQPDFSRDHIAGSPSARLQLVEYADFECPACQAAQRVLTRIRKRVGDELVLVVRHFPIIDAHPTAMIAAEAVEAAASQGRFWEMYRRIYGSRRPPTEESLRGHAVRLRLDVARFDRELRNHMHARRVLEDLETGLQSGVNSTPTFYVNGIRHDDEHTFDALVAALQRVRAGRVGEQLEHPGRP
jgi:predicted DsbA family dithiol-disulfide isomerase